MIIFISAIIGWTLALYLALRLRKCEALLNQLMNPLKYGFDIHSTIVEVKDIIDTYKHRKADSSGNQPKDNSHG